MLNADAPLVYAHIGDLHLTIEDEENHHDLGRIVDELAGPFAEALDFVYLPGDNADNGLPEQYALVARQLARLPQPVHIITGDHDMEPGGLDNFYRGLDAASLPKAVDHRGVRCLFLDICGPGGGGPDFRLGDKQIRWLEHELREAAATDRRCAVFMHSYPADLKGPGETDAVNKALAAPEVLLVDMGHTHYNELANDGRTIFAATRSTGQIEEGPVGYSIVTIDGPVVSWRFRKLGDPAPVVLVTTPADRRLATGRHHVPTGRCDIRASVLGPRPIRRCDCRIDGGAALPMERRGRNRFALTIDVTDLTQTITVEAEDDDGVVGHETIEPATDEALALERRSDGSDADSIGAWVERDIHGTQLGPNRNGRKW